MSRPMLALLTLAISLFGTQCWGAICSNPPPTTTTSPTTAVVSCTNQFSPAVTSATYDFTSAGDGFLKLTFLGTVQTTFTITATVNHTIDPFDTSEFPAGTVAVTYFNGNKDQYDFTGNAGGPNGVPQKGPDYTGMIRIELTYSVGQTVHTPAFAHAPDGFTTFLVNFLRGYFQPPFTDPTMCGDVPGLSSIAAADEPFSSPGNTSCPLTLTPTNVPSGQKPQIEIIFKIVGSGSSCSGTGVRDKTAKLYVSTLDSSGRSFPALKNVEGNKFHWVPRDALNEYDISTETLVTGQMYTVTVISELVSPQSANFTAP